jgi:hypothetical protein
MPKPEDQQPANIPLSPATARSGASLALKVGQALDALRLAVLGILLTIGLTVLFGLSGPWPWRVIAGVSATVAGAAALHFQRPRKILLKIADWVVKT